MGNVQARQYRRVARTALREAQRLRRQIGGPRCSGAIVDYCDGRLNAHLVPRFATVLELNEFVRLEPEAYTRWFLEKRGSLRCRPGHCRYPEDQFHWPDCHYYCDLPEDVAVSMEELEDALRNCGADPRLIESWVGFSDRGGDRRGGGRAARDGPSRRSGHRSHHGHRDRHGYSSASAHASHSHPHPRRSGRPGRRRSPSHHRHNGSDGGDLISDFSDPETLPKELHADYVPDLISEFDESVYE